MNVKLKRENNEETYKQEGIRDILQGKRELEKLRKRKKVRTRKEGWLFAAGTSQKIMSRNRDGQRKPHDRQSVVMSDGFIGTVRKSGKNMMRSEKGR